jgi:hypothetical protein
MNADEMIKQSNQLADEMMAAASSEKHSVMVHMAALSNLVCFHIITDEAILHGDPLLFFDEWAVMTRGRIESYMKKEKEKWQ